MQKKSNKLWFLFIAAVYCSMPAASIYSGLLQKMPIYELTAHLFISVILSCALVQYVKRSQLKQKRELPDKPLFVLLFVGANFLMAVVKAENYGFLWLLPMIMLAISAGVEYAMVAYIVLLAQNILIHVNAISAWELVTTVIYGAFCIWLMQQKLTVRVLPYLFISMLSVDGILQILKRQFQLALLKKESKQLLIELVSVLVLEVFIFGYLKYREGKESLSGNTAEEVPLFENMAEESASGDESISGEETAGEPEESSEEELSGEESSGGAENISGEEPEESYEEEHSEEPESISEKEPEKPSGEEESSEEKDITEEEPEEEPEEEFFEEEEFSGEESTSEEESEGAPENTEKDLSDILAADYSLRLRLQEYSEQIFQHSLRISTIAAQAAEYMNGNVLLAQAGGLYHEIGRIVDEKNYINEGERLLREEGWSEDLIAVVRQHTASEKPQSLEAAIVLLADYIISTSDYLEKVGRRKEISDEKLVNTIFRNRLNKGNLDEAGLSEEEIEQLREYFAELVFEL